MQTRQRVVVEAAKIAILTQTVAAQAGAHGIPVNCIAPETILTERNLERIPSESQQALRESHPLKRLGQPEDVARAARYLASPNASWKRGSFSTSPAAQLWSNRSVPYQTSNLRPVNLTCDSSSIA